MSIQEQKLRLIEELVKLEDLNVIEQVKQLLLQKIPLLAIPQMVIRLLGNNSFSESRRQKRE